MLLKCFHISDCEQGCSLKKSHSIRSREEFDSATEIILGHSTSSVFINSILEHGLIPDRMKHRSIDDNALSDNKSVYLATCYDSFYGKRAISAHKGKAIIIDVIVSRKDLVADESVFSPAELKELTLESEEALYRSLSFGACKHLGDIPLSSILTITDLEGTILYQANQ